MINFIPPTTSRATSRATRAGNLRIWGAFAILRRRNVEFARADAIAQRYNRRFEQLARETMTEAERAEVRARREAGSKLLYGVTK